VALIRERRGTLKRLERRGRMNVPVEISIGEFFDKITILEIKRSRIKDADKLANIEKELDRLNCLLETLPFSREDVKDEVDELKALNEKLWDVEEELREKEARKDFGDGFIRLARSVYQSNDRRFELKRAINGKLGSDFTEEKSYQPYR
jgi:hypothetical protein